MTKFLVDQNFNEQIVDGLTRRDAALEFTLVRDVDLAEAADPTVLERASAHGLILLTHDRNTVTRFAYDRVAAGTPMSGVFLVADDMLVGNAIDEILIAANCLSKEECRNRVWYFPM